jgi:hypothetical protein
MKNEHRGRVTRRVVIAVLGAVAALTVMGGVALAQGGGGDTFYACANSQNDRVDKISTGEPPTCSGVWEPVSWNSEGPAGEQGPQGEQGPTGPIGPAGGLTCADERRINDAAPGFEVRGECGVVLAATSLGPNGEYRRGSHFIESVPFGNPPGDHDVAQRFEVVSDSDLILEYVDLAIHFQGSNPGKLEIFLVGETARQGALSSEPDMSNVLEHWQAAPLESDEFGAGVVAIPNAPWGMRLSSKTGPKLEVGQRYWLVGIVTRDNTQYRWWLGADVLPTGSATAERYGIDVGQWPAGSWIGSDHPEGLGLRVAGIPN